MMRAALISLLCLTGCHVSSKTAMYGSGGRTSYNSVIQKTTNEQMLLNLVRLRYFDTPFFLDVSTITTQYTKGSRLNPFWPIPGFNTENPGSLGAEFSWQNQPTIQYTPLEGQEFAQQLMQPIRLNLLQQIIFSGWDISRVFQLAVQSFDNLENANQASAPTPVSIPLYKKFFKVIDLMRELQTSGELHVGVMYKQNGNVHCKGEEPIANVLQLSFPKDNPSSEELTKHLTGVTEQRGRYYLTMALGYDEEAEIGIIPRSILGIMYYLSLSVHVPPEDEARGSVAVTRYPDGRYFDWTKVIGKLMSIHYSYEYPKNAHLAVRYRNLWFYIRDDDIESKRTFVLLTQLYNLKSSEVKSEAPLLSIPLGA